jgi:hypothetical protein
MKNVKYSQYVELPMEQRYLLKIKSFRAKNIFIDVLLYNPRYRVLEIKDKHTCEYNMLVQQNKDNHPFHETIKIREIDCESIVALDEQ